MSRGDFRWARERNAFVGREAEFTRMEKAFASGARLLTLVGPPGVGKTRLAQRFASRVAARGSEVVTASLAAVTEKDAVARTLCQALDLEPAPAEGLERLTKALAERGDGLLVLDNLEHIADAAAEVAETLLDEVPTLAILGTSRQPLGAHGEMRVFVEPLPIEEAAALFHRRAQEVDAELLEPGEDDAVAEIARRVDGIPLAIELAAARAILLPPSEILARLERPFALLDRDRAGKGGPRAGLQASIAASWQLLDPAEREALAQCSIFPDEFPLAAAEAVLDLSAHGADPIDVIQALRERSLLRAAPAAAGASAGEVRIALYASIRAFAAQRLEESGSARGARERHARYYAELAGARSEEAIGAEREAALAKLAESEPHLVQALREASDPADRARIGVALAILFDVWGPRARQIEAADAALEDAGDAAAPALWARAAQLRGYAALAGARHEQASELMTRAAEVARDGGDLPTERFALMGLALVELRRGNVAEAERIGRRILAEAAEDEAVRSLVLVRLSFAQTIAGRVDEARALAEAEMRRARRSATRHHEAACLLRLAHCEHEAGDLVRARERYERATGLLEVTGPRRDAASALLLRAWLEIELGDYDAARDFLDASARAQRTLVEPVIAAWSEGAEGALRLVRGDAAEAAVRLRAAAERAGEGALIRPQALAFAAMAEAIGDRAEEAARLCAELEEEGRTGAAAARELAPIAAASVELARARAACDPAEEATFRGAAEARLEATEARGSWVRVARQLLRRDVERTRSRAPAETERPPAGGRDEPAETERPPARGREAPAETERPPARGRDAPPPAASGESGGAEILAVAGGGERFRPPGAEQWVDLKRYRAARRIFIRLTRAHADGEPPLGVDDLLEAGWPGERVAYEAGMARVYAAIASLRRLGLREILETVDGGYRFAPGVSLRFDSSSELDGSLRPGGSHG